ncbi:acyclic terpene utilization AtuA family protein [Saccharopolyspora rosea]|uniref:Acyclic terpene utilization AtuA family protein n=1 Tax=Saccharopolyspora rosea TaxID=524884 RepID=A0ABW3FUK4_9PSEU|nr:acyclic terpene utilization AtuA family protein [Saccharopolyspora rosea]
MARAVRVAGFSGYLGDRRGALDEAMAGDPVDVLIGDYLAEFTMAMLAARSSPGYVTYFLDQLRPHLAELAERGCRVVVNAGGSDPAGLAAAVRALAAEAGVRLRVAHVEGDDVLSAVDELRAAGHELRNADTAAPLSEWGAEPVAAHAYLGGWGIAAALGEGADVVVCGRVTDASLTAGAAAWWHGWRSTDWDRLAGAVVAGHVIECGPHAVGGNFSGFTGIPGVVHPGFPVAEVAADGSAVITKHARDGGAVTVDTVTAQLLYEIQGPRYLNPDVTAHLDTVRLREVGPNRVEVSGAEGSPPPPTTKVAVFAPIGHQIVHTLHATGLDVADKTELIRAQVAELVAGQGVEFDVTALGTAAEDPETQWEATVQIRVMATAPEPEPLRRLVAGLGGLYLSSFPGFYADSAARQAATPGRRIAYWPALLSAEAVPHEVVLDDGVRIPVAPPVETAEPVQPVHPEPEPLPSARTRRMPLGRVAHARSGDKGGNSNVGIWVADPDAWPWLRRLLSTDELRRLMPEAKHLDVVRHEFPHLRAVHFVLRGLLGTGGSSNLRVDPIGKAVGEFLRARHVDVPVELTR